ncbi:MAG TPA: YceI family protein [Aggregatilineaceae bacterium]|nr:YceI family protein [Aggregatilineaceae bacterium]
MASMRRYQWLVASGIVVLIIGIGAVIVSNQILDPGSKNDTSTDLRTPVVTIPPTYYFDVVPEQSHVDFTTEVTGLGTVEGVFPVEGGTIQLEPVGNELRVHVYLEIAVDRVEANGLVQLALRAAMKTGDYPLAFYVAESKELVPVTEEEIAFTLDGTLDVHNVEHAHTMTVRAQLVKGSMWAIATSDLDLADHAVEFPPPIESSTIKMTANLQAVETVKPDTATETAAP